MSLAVGRRVVTTWAALGVVACGAEPASAASCAPALTPGALVLTEVFADPDGPDLGREWFELYNASASELALDGVTITHSKPDGSRAKVHRLRALTVAPAAYVVLGNAVPSLAPAYLDYGYGGELGELFNGAAGRLTLSCGERELDSAAYRPIGGGHALALDGGEVPDATANDEPARWCQATDEEFEPGSFGSPGRTNADCEVALPGLCRDSLGLRPTEPPAPGDVVITELMPNPERVDDALGEWVELWVARSLDLNDLSLDRAADSAPPAPLAAEPCLRVDGPGYAILARSRDPAANGGLSRVDAALPLGLVGGSAQAPGDLQLLVGDRLLDAVRWRRSAAGKALQLDPDYFSPAANDEERVFCDAAAPYGAGDRGTPGADNAHCAVLPPPGQCEEAGRLRPIAAPAPGQLVITEIMANPAGTDSEQEWFELVNVGSGSFDLNGLAVDRAGDSARPAVISAPGCLSVGAGRYAVLARSADPARNGGLPRVDAIYALSASDAGNLQIVSGEQVLDAVTWTDAPTSASAQLDPAFTTPAGNDLEAHFCAATAPYGAGANLGTPGAANRPCP